MSLVKKKVLFFLFFSTQWLSGSSILERLKGISNWLFDSSTEDLTTGWKAFSKIHLIGTFFPSALLYSAAYTLKKTGIPIIPNLLYPYLGDKKTFDVMSIAHYGTLLFAGVNTYLANTIVQKKLTEPSEKKFFQIHTFEIPLLELATFLTQEEVYLATQIAIDRMENPNPENSSKGVFVSSFSGAGKSFLGERIEALVEVLRIYYANFLHTREKTSAEKSIEEVLKKSSEKKACIGKMMDEFNTKKKKELPFLDDFQWHWKKNNQNNVKINEPDLFLRANNLDLEKVNLETLTKHYETRNASDNFYYIELVDAKTLQEYAQSIVQGNTKYPELTFDKAFKDKYSLQNPAFSFIDNGLDQLLKKYKGKEKNDARDYVIAQTRLLGSNFFKERLKPYQRTHFILLSELEGIEAELQKTKKDESYKNYQEKFGNSYTNYMKNIEEFMAWLEKKYSDKKIDSTYYVLNKSELQNMYVGNTEKAITKMFEQAEKMSKKTNKLVNIIMNEANDVFNRGDDRISNTLVSSYLYGMEKLGKNIFIYASANKNIDEAFFNPIRLTKIIMMFATSYSIELRLKNLFAEKINSYSFLTYNTKEILHDIAPFFVGILPSQDYYTDIFKLLETLLMHDRDYQAPFKKDADVLYYISPGNTDDTVIFEPKKQLMENAQALDDQAYYNLIFGPADYKSGYKGGFLIRKPYQSFFQEFAPLQSRIIQFLNALMLAFKSDINAMQAFLTLLYEDLKDNTHIYYDQKNDTYASSSFSKEFLIKSIQYFAESYQKANTEEPFDKWLFKREHFAYKSIPELKSFIETKKTLLNEIANERNDIESYGDFFQNFSIPKKYATDTFFTKFKNNFKNIYGLIPFLDLFWDVIKQFSSIQLNKIEKDNKIFYIASATPKEEDKNEKMREKPIDHVKGRMKFLLKSFDFNSQFYTFLARNQNNSALQGREFNKSTMDFLKTFVEQQQNSA